MEKYKLWFRNGSKPRTAASYGRAMEMARNALGVRRLYRGALYQTDEADGEERRAVTGLDLWKEKRNATREMSTSADCVITWR